MIWITVIEWVIIGMITTLFAFITYHRKSKRKFKLNWAFALFVFSYITLWPLAWLEELKENRIQNKRSLFHPVTLSILVFTFVISLGAAKIIISKKQIQTNQRAVTIYSKMY